MAKKSLSLSDDTLALLHKLQGVVREQSPGRKSNDSVKWSTSVNTLASWMDFLLKEGELGLRQFTDMDWVIIKSSLNNYHQHPDVEKNLAYTIAHIKHYIRTQSHVLELYVSKEDTSLLDAKLSNLNYIETLALVLTANPPPAQDAIPVSSMMKSTGKKI